MTLAYCTKLFCRRWVPTISKTGGTGEQHRHLSLSVTQHPTASAVSRLEVGCKKYFCGRHGRSFFLDIPFHRTCHPSSLSEKNTGYATRPCCNEVARSTKSHNYTNILRGKVLELFAIGGSFVSESVIQTARLVHFVRPAVPTHRLPASAFVQWPNLNRCHAGGL